jgi:hypothetical protein
MRWPDSIGLEHIFFLFKNLQQSSCSSEDCCDLVAWTGHQNNAIAYSLDDNSVYSEDHFDIIMLVVLDLARDLIDQDGAELLGFGSNGQFGIHLVHPAKGVVKVCFALCS